jgi:hypothetical protein
MLEMVGGGVVVAGVVLVTRQPTAEVDDVADLAAAT